MPASPAPAPAAKRRILLVDDDQGLREMFSHVLTGEGYHVLAAGSGPEALALLRSQAVDLVVSDINMPEQDGYQLLETIRRDPAIGLIPVILMTARPAFTGLRKGMGMGADDYLPKPFTIPELVSAVSQQLAKRDSLRSESERELQSLRDCIALGLPHELLTPLNGILGVAELLTAGPAGPAELAEYAGMLRVSGERLQRLIQNILLNAQLALLAREPETAARFRGSATGRLGGWLVEQLTRTAAAHDRVADLRLDPGLSHEGFGAAMSAEHLGKVLVELLENACKFSPRGQPIELSAASEGGELVLTVRDYGRGMAWEEIAQLGAYRQFGRREHAQEGAGLGATIARGLVELHGGTIVWESAPGRGCNVRVRLPLAPAVAPA